MNVPLTPSMVKDIVYMEEERTFWEVVRHHERPPFFDTNEGVGNRLNRAARVVTEGRITPNSDGSYSIEGAEGRTYRVTDSCSCPDWQIRKSQCYHSIAVALYVEWQRRLRGSAPVELGTLRAGTLPLGEGKGVRNEGVREDGEGSKGRGSKERGGEGDTETPAASLPHSLPTPHSLTPSLPSQPLPFPPVTVDERLALAPTLEERQRNYTQGSLPPTADDEDPQYVTPPVTVDERLAQAASVAMDHVYDALPVPQEDRMPEDEYIPEPDDHDAPVTVLVPPVATPALRPLAPADDDLEQALATWTVQRGIVRKFLAQELKANVDYYTLRIGGKDSKPSLSKAGAEKVLGWLRWSASFAPDTGTWEMLGRPTDVVFYVCTLRTRSGEIVGEGRGARSLKKDNGDVNKAIKMAEKSAMVSSVLRTGAISDCFTQDLEDMQEEPVKSPSPARPTGQSQDLRSRIWARVQELAPEATTREAVTRVIMERTGLALHPDHYAEILAKLGA